MKLMIVTMLLALLLIPNIAYAESVKLIENTDICSYDEKLDKDYCYSIYEICDNITFDSKELDFDFKRENGISAVSKLNYVLKETDISNPKCKRIKIEAYKNPYINIDNIPCYKGYCYKQYAWWNTSFLHKLEINASINSGEVTFPVLINDSYVDINGDNQYIWCNYTLNTTSQIVGYFYWTDNSFYRCIDRTQTYAVEMDIDLGNESNIDYVYASDVLYVQHMNDGTTDSSIYSKNASVTGSLADETGQIAISQTFANDYISVTSTNGPTGISPFTLSVWFNTIDADGTLVIIGQVSPTFKSYRLQVAGSKLSLSGFGAGSNIFTTSENIADGAWHQGVGVFYANDTGYLYLDGVFKGSGSPATSANLDGQDITIGAYDDGNLKFGGEIDEVRIWNRSLSSDEIRAMYENQNGTFNIAILVNRSNLFPPPPPPNVTLLDNVSLIYDISEELPISIVYCSGRRKITIRERTSCLTIGCMTTNQTDVLYCAYGCEDNLTSIGAECIPTTFETFYTGWGLFLIAFVILLFIAYSLKKKKRKGKRFL